MASKAKSPAKEKSPSRFKSYSDYVIEAVQALQTDDKPFVSLTKIRDYIFSYIEEAKPENIKRLVPRAVDGLVNSKVFKKKRGSVAFGAKAGDAATTAAPERAVVREKPAKAVTLDDTLTSGLVQTTRSGRTALRRY
jgi:hypothetical protein